MYLDAHTHLDHCYFDETRDETITRAVQADVKLILTAGMDNHTNRQALDLAQRHDSVQACVGIHPVQYGKNSEGKETIVTEYQFDVKDELQFMASQKNSIAAIGEIGLDYHWDTISHEEQRKTFTLLLELAKKLNKPVVVHSRKAEQDCIDIIKQVGNNKVIMHCFTGPKKLVKQVIDEGWYLTAPTSIVRSQQFQDNVMAAPITQLLCETDAPYMTPFKDKRNEPSFVVEAYKKVAELKNMELEEVAKNVWMNWQRVS